ncbi:hypothetical protein C7T94_07345 [Pedobacter yulinensis]|uniref:DUF922 domain-containing protein n=1 Tax=Pedobacter yulinensis TaxID=2126353 RepID=A0A2T3HJ56_9SPHI|nr:DUF922 domain-containing protein [Pedobacter yulinensis]PST82485.1 hypothetical protein C7T94_07345 [Pedobacter yulinensis]
MNRLTGLAGLALLCLSFQADQQVYPEKLGWKTHFRGAPDYNSPFAALTVLRWHYEYKARITNGRLDIRFNQFFGIDKNKSWVKSERIRNETISNQLLHHEQGHADIHYLMSKEARRVMESRSYRIETYKKEIAALADEVGKYFDEMQKRYDAETAHGNNLKKQAQWDEIIADWRYEDYISEK